MTLVTASAVSAARRLGLTLDRADLYPPLSNPDGDFVAFDTSLASPSYADFDFTLNGHPGPIPGLRVFAGPRSGFLLFEAAFIQHYNGPWPAVLELRAWQANTIVDTAMLRLHDTRAMRPASAEASFSPNPVHVVEGLRVPVRANVTFRDEQGVVLPEADIPWNLQVAPETVGVVAEGQCVFVTEDARPGPVDVELQVVGGIRQPARLIVEPQRDVAFHLSQYDLYPPMKGTVAKVSIHHGLVPGEIDPYSFTVNGQVPGAYPGITLTRDVSGNASLWVDQAFLSQYQGPWPARVQVIGHTVNQPIAARTLLLHDTRSAVCARMTAKITPSDTILIPESGTALATVVGTFHDDADRIIPSEEIAPQLVMIDPMQGVSLVDTTLVIHPSAMPGEFRLELRANENVSSEVILRLTGVTLP